MDKDVYSGSPDLSATSRCFHRMDKDVYRGSPDLSAPSRCHISPTHFWWVPGRARWPLGLPFLHRSGMDMDIARPPVIRRWAKKKIKT